MADFNTIINDDGSNSVGTLIDKAQLQSLLMGAVVTSTSTGAQNNWAPVLVGHTLVEWNGAADAAFTGLATGVAGQRVTIKNITTTKVATFAHASGSSTAANRFVNLATSAVTPVAPGGRIAYQHDGTNWQLVAHEQGAWITPTYVAGNFTGNGAMTWTVDAGDVIQFRYKLRGKDLFVQAYLAPTSIGGTLNTTLLLLIPGGFTAAVLNTGGISTGFANSAGVAQAITASVVNTTQLGFNRLSTVNWGASTNDTYVNFSTVFEVT